MEIGVTTYVKSQSWLALPGEETNFLYYLQSGIGCPPPIPGMLGSYFPIGTGGGEDVCIPQKWLLDP
jgi:hypothetical protein